MLPSLNLFNSTKSTNELKNKTQNQLQSGQISNRSQDTVSSQSSNQQNQNDQNLVTPPKINLKEKLLQQFEEQAKINNIQARSPKNRMSIQPQVEDYYLGEDSDEELKKQKQEKNLITKSATPKIISNNLNKKQNQNQQKKPSMFNDIVSRNNNTIQEQEDDHQSDKDNSYQVEKSNKNKENIAIKQENQIQEEKTELKKEEKKTKKIGFLSKLKNKKKLSLQTSSLDENGRPVISLMDINLSQPIDQYLLKPNVNFSDPVDRKLIINLMQKPKKGLLEINFIRRGLESTEFFSKEENKKMLKKVQPKILDQCLKLRFIKKRFVIFNQGEIGDCFYIILHGQVYTYIKKSPEQIQQEQEENKKRKFNRQGTIKTIDIEAQNQKELQKKRLLETNFFKRAKKQLNSRKKSKTKFSSLLKSTALDNMNEEEYYKFFNSNQKMVKLYQSGDSFGELALLTKQKRAATMECKEDTYVIELSKQGFDLIVSTYLKYVNGLKVQFLRSFEFFKPVPYLQLVRFIQSLEEVQLKRKTILYKEGDKSKFVYLIQQGDVEISQVQNLPVQIGPYKQKINSNQLKQKFQTINKTQNKRVTLFLMGVGQSFGTSEILSEKTTRIHQAMVYSEYAVLYKVKKEDFLNFLNFENCLHILKKTNKKEKMLLDEREEQISKGYQQIQQTFDQSMQKASTPPTRHFQNVIQKELFEKYNPQDQMTGIGMLQIPQIPETNNPQAIQETINTIKNQSIKQLSKQSEKYASTQGSNNDLSQISKSMRRVSSQVQVKNNQDNSQRGSLSTMIPQQTKTFKQIQQGSMSSSKQSNTNKQSNIKDNTPKILLTDKDKKENNHINKNLNKPHEKTHTVSSRHQKLMKDVPIDQENIEKYIKLTYSQGFIDQTQAKKNMLKYLNKDQLDLHMIYDLDNPDHYQFPRRLIQHIKNEEQKILNRSGGTPTSNQNQNNNNFNNSLYQTNNRQNSSSLHTPRSNNQSTSPQSKVKSKRQNKVSQFGSAQKNIKVSSQTNRALQNNNSLNNTSQYNNKSMFNQGTDDQNNVSQQNDKILNDIQSPRPQEQSQIQNQQVSTQNLQQINSKLTSPRFSSNNELQEENNIQKQTAGITHILKRVQKKSTTDMLMLFQQQQANQIAEKEKYYHNQYQNSQKLPENFHKKNSSELSQQNILQLQTSQYPSHARNNTVIDVNSSKITEHQLLQHRYGSPQTRSPQHTMSSQSKKGNGNYFFKSVNHSNSQKLPPIQMDNIYDEYTNQQDAVNQQITKILNNQNQSVNNGSPMNSNYYNEPLYGSVYQQKRDKLKKSQNKISKKSYKVPSINQNQQYYTCQEQSKIQPQSENGVFIIKKQLQQRNNIPIQNQN